MWTWSLHELRKTAAPNQKEYFGITYRFFLTAPNHFKSTR
jgi:hypothetical protein